MTHELAHQDLICSEKGYFGSKNYTPPTKEREIHHRTEASISHLGFQSSTMMIPKDKKIKSTLSHTLIFVDTPALQI